MAAVVRTIASQAPSGNLARLLEAEAALDRRLGERAAEAEALVAAARRDAEARLAALPAELAAIGRAAEAELDQATRVELERIREEAEVACRHWAEAMASRCEALADHVVREVLRDLGVEAP